MSGTRECVLEIARNHQPRRAVMLITRKDSSGELDVITHMTEDTDEDALKALNQVKMYPYTSHVAGYVAPFDDKRWEIPQTVFTSLSDRQLQHLTL